MKITAIRLLGLVATGLLLFGCEGSKPGTAGGQVLARVNSQEVSVHQLNRLITDQGGATPAQRNDLTERLIDRELAVQQALAAKLDRQPDVMLRLEEARRDVLAAAWSERAAGHVSAPAQNDVARYYSDHPGLFAERKLYRLQELAVPSDSPLVDEMAARLQRGERVPELRAWLRAQGARFSDQSIVRSAEQLPIESVEKLRQAQPGGAVAFRSTRALTVYQVQSAEPMPVAWSAAEPVIRAYLATQARNQAVSGEMQRLRKQARIEIVAATPDR